MRHKIIKETWTDKEFKLYMDNAKEIENKHLSFEERLFIIFVLAYINQENYKDEIKSFNFLKRMGVYQRPYKIGEGLIKYTILILSISAILGGVAFWQNLKSEKRRKLAKNIYFLLIIVKKLPSKDICNYRRWRDYTITRKEMLSLTSLPSELIKYIVDFESYTNCDNYSDCINLIYSTYYYIYDNDKSAPFSDFIFDIVRSENSDLRDRLYEDLFYSKLRYEIHTVYQEYCQRNNIKEKSIFDCTFQQPEKDLTQEPSPSPISESKSDKKYYPKLSLDDNKTKKLFDILKQEEYLPIDTIYAVFHYRLSGRDEPDTLTKIKWLKDKNELCYFIYRLTRSNIDNEMCKKTNTGQFYGKTIDFFEIEGDEWKTNDNLSDMAKKLSDPKKDVINRLLNKVFDSKNLNK